MIAIAQLAVMRRAQRIVHLVEHVGEALMCRRARRVERDCRFILIAGGVVLVVLVERVSVVDPGGYVVGMMVDGLFIGGSRGGTITGRVQQRPEIGQRAEMRGIAKQYRKVCGFGGLVGTARVQVQRALEEDVDRLCGYRFVRHGIAKRSQ